MGVAVDIQCPTCSTMNVVDMEHDTEWTNSRARALISSMFDMPVPDEYSFNGTCMCTKCNKEIAATLQVSAAEVTKDGRCCSRGNNVGRETNAQHLLGGQ